MKKIFILSLVISLFLGLAIFISNCGTTGGGSTVPTPWIYCGSSGGFEILVINGSTNTSTETIDLSPEKPWHIAASPDGKKIYASTDTTTVIIIDTTTNTSVGAFSVPLSQDSYGMVVSHDGKYLYMTDSGSTNLYKVYLTAGNTYEAITTLSSNSRRIALNPDSTKAYVCGTSSLGLDIVNLQTKSVIDTISFINNPRDVTVKGDYVYVTIGHSDASSPDVVSIDMGTDIVAYELFCPEDYLAGIVSIPGKNKLYVSNNTNPGKLFIINSSVPTFESTVITGEGTSFHYPALMTASQNYAYVYDAESHDKIGVINTNTDKIIKYIYGINSSGVYNNPVIIYK